MLLFSISFSFILEVRLYAHNVINVSNLVSLLFMKQRVKKWEGKLKDNGAAQTFKWNFKAFAFNLF